jgi:hypothetical protein
MQDEFTIEGASDGTIWGYDLELVTMIQEQAGVTNELQSHTNRTEKCKSWKTGYLLSIAKKSSQRVFVYLQDWQTKGLFDQAYGYWLMYQSALRARNGLLLAIRF